MDEYQDTSEDIYNILTLIKNNHEEFVVGLFGDKMQKIYDKGTTKVDESYEIIEKTFNRRSSDNVISISSKISGRHEISIYKDNYKGEVKYYRETNLKETINDLKYKWEIDNDNYLQVLLLRNSDLAKELGFPNFYKCFQESKEYKGSRFDNLNKETLTTKITDLGYIQTIFYNITELYIKLSKDTLFLSDVPLDYKTFDQNDFLKLSKLIKPIKTEEIKTIEEFITMISSDDYLSNVHFKDMLNNSLGLSKRLSNKNKLKAQLNIEINEHMLKYENEEDEKSLKTEELYSIQIDEYINWYNFIQDKQDDLVQYSTFHSSKGKEYPNVLIQLEDRFANKEYFKNALDLIETNQQSSEDLGLNLLYVVSTRAIKNMAVIYNGEKNNEKYNNIFNLNKTMERDE